MSYMDPRPEGLNTEKAPESIVETLRTPDLKTVTFDAALNAAGWEFVERVPAEQMSPWLFNNLKPVLKAAIEKWLAEQPAAQSAGQEPVAWVDEKSETLVFGGWDKKPFANVFKPVFYAAPVNASVPVGETALRSRWNRIANSEDMNEEPVAWRWRWKDLPDAGWQLSSVCGWRDTEHIDAQPLYLHPPHQPKRTVTYVCPVCAASLERQE